MYFFSLSPSPLAPEPEDMSVTPVDDIDVIVDEDPEVDAAAAVSEDEDDEDDDDVKTDEVVVRVPGGWDTSDDTGNPPAGTAPVSDDGMDTAVASKGSLGGREARLPAKGCGWGWGYSPSGGFTSPNVAPTGKLGLLRPSGKRPLTPNPTGLASCEAGTGVTTGVALQELVVVVVEIVAVVAAVAGWVWG